MPTSIPDFVQIGLLKVKKYLKVADFLCLKDETEKTTMKDKRKKKQRQSRKMKVKSKDKTKKQVDIPGHHTQV